MPSIIAEYDWTLRERNRNRRRFESIQVENVLRTHNQRRISCMIEKLPGKLRIESENIDDTMDILSRSFGIASIYKAIACSSDLSEISALAVQAAQQAHSKEMNSFAIRAKRAGSHSYTSMQLASEVGREVSEAFGGDLKVSLSSPDLEIFIAVRDRIALIHTDILPGPGGLPVRSSGKALSVVQDRKSLLSSWLMLKKGFKVLLLNDSDIADSELEILRQWTPWWSRIIQSNQGDLKDIMKERNCRALAFGWTSDEKAEKTLSELDLPIHLPLTEMKNEEISNRMRKLFPI